MLTNLDVLAATRLHNFSTNTLLFYNKDALAQDRNLFDSRDPEIASLQTQLLAVVTPCECQYNLLILLLAG
jgi:hypothetical protein